MIVFGVIEWTWCEAILDESARDTFSIGGFLVTVVGFAFTLWQLWKTKSAAEAAELASREATAESRLAYQKFALALAQRFIHEAKIHVENEAWESAALRISDLADQVGQLALLTQGWDELSSELHMWSTTCQRLKAGELKRFPKPRWREYCHRIEVRLNQLLGPFAKSHEEGKQ